MFFIVILFYFFYSCFFYTNNFKNKSNKINLDCAWINNCVGEHNLRHFFAFLFLTSFLCFYAASVCVALFLAIIKDKRLYSLQVIDKLTGQRSPVTHQHILIYFLNSDLILSMLAIFVFLCGILVLSFLGYHLLLVWRGTTSTETFKWDRIKYELEVNKEIIVERMEISHLKPTQRGNKESEKLEQKYQDQDQHQDQNEDEKNGKVMNRKQNLKGKTKDKTVIKNRKDLKNVYNHGFIGNMKEILFPKSI